MSESVNSLGKIAGDAIQQIVREMLRRKVGGYLVETNLDEIDLRLPIALKADPGVFAAELVAVVDRILDEAIQRAASFRPGRALCHRCRTASCEHSRPPSCRDVFAGYAPTGVPQWKDFAQLCLEQRHPQVDRLYEAPPAFLTMVQAGDELRARLLRAFRSTTYELKGQLTAGFFPLKTRRDEGRGVLALTFQVVGPRGSRDCRRLALNILGVAPGGEELDTVWERYRDVPWRRAVQWGQSAVASVRPTPRGGRIAGRDQEARIESILRGIARRLERDSRARGRRTHHAEKRHESGQRPTRMALDDARSAGTEAFLIDERSGARVVLGDRGRTHFFATDGRLVSSARYSRDAIDRKRRLGLWRDATPDEAGELRGQVGASRDEPAELE